MAGKAEQTVMVAFRVDDQMGEWLDREAERLRAMVPGKRISASDVARCAVKSVMDARYVGGIQPPRRESHAEKVKRWHASGALLMCMKRSNSKQKIRVVEIIGDEVGYQLDGQTRIRRALIKSITGYYIEAAE